MNVEDVRVGDRIAPPPGHEGCADPHCGEVVRLFRNTTDRVVSITAVTRPRARERQSASRDGGEAGEEDGEPPSAESRQTIRCTPGHPFFVEGRGWVLAGDLRAGDELEARGERVVVAAVEVRAERAETFNFEVACHHTYRVSSAAGEPAVLVHNTSLLRAKTWQAFQRKTRGWFTRANSWFQRGARALRNPQLEAAQAWHWYKAARHSADDLVVGEIRAARSFAKQNSGFQRLWASPWNLGVNDAWLIGGIERGARFRVVSNILDPALQKTMLRGGREVESVFAREVRMLKDAGYRFEQGAGMAAGHGWLVR